MIEYFGEVHHDCHNMMDAVDHTKMLAAQYYTSILTQLTNHKNDKHIHITTEDRDKWDNKADKASIRDLEMSLINKANKNEIPRNVSELKNDVPYLTASTLEAQLEALGYVTLHDIKCKLCNNFNLDDYATLEWVNNILRQYALKTDLDNYYTKAEANNRFALKGDYLTRAIADGIYQPKGDYALRSEIPSIPEIPSLAGYLKSTDINYISSVPASGDGIYTIGRIVVGNTEYPVYGRDNATSGGGSSEGGSANISYTPNSEIANSPYRYIIGMLGINGTTYTLYGKDRVGSSDGSGSGEGGSGEGYDDTELRGLIQDLQDALDAFRQQKTAEISEDVEDLIDRFNELKDLFETGEIFHDSGWQEKLDAYLQIVGKGFYDEDGNLIGNWSQLLQTYNQIKEYVAQVKEIVDPETGAVVNYDAIYTKIDQKIEENTAIATLSANHAFADGQKNLIEYLSSGIDAVAGDLTTFANFYSTYSSRIADVTSLISNKVDKTTYEASLKAVADTTMYKVQRDNDGKPVLNANGDYIYLDANGNVTDKEHRIIDTQNTAGLVLESGLGSAVAGLFATNDSGVTAKITEKVNDAVSNITISADQVDINAVATAVRGSLSANDLSLGGDPATSRFNADGSGYVANQNISWDTNGNVSIKGSNIQTDNTTGYVATLRSDNSHGYLYIAPAADVASGNWGNTGGYLTAGAGTSAADIRMIGDGGYNGMYYDASFSSRGLTILQKASRTSNSGTQIFTIFANGSSIELVIKDPANPETNYTRITPGEIELHSASGTKTITVSS